MQLFAFFGAVSQALNIFIAVVYIRHLMEVEAKKSETSPLRVLSILPPLAIIVAGDFISFLLLVFQARGL
jgi:hypothetical protein